MTANPNRWAVDFPEYLRFERDAAERHELIDGEIVAKAGATRRHNVICGRLHDAIRPVLGDGPCILERSDQRLAVDAQGKGWVGYYPDLAVYCSDDVHPLDADTRVSPTLLVEVTSKTTEKKRTISRSRRSLNTSSSLTHGASSRCGRRARAPGRDGSRRRES